MSERLSPLHGGRANRGPPRGRRLRQAGLALLGLLITVGALLGFMSAQAVGPGAVKFRAESGGGAGTRGGGAGTSGGGAGTGGGGASAAGAGEQAGGGSQYGTQLAPDAERVNVSLKLGLRSGLLFDVRTGEVLWQRHPDRVLAIASLTKMMTALVVVSHSRPADHVLITPDAVHFSGSGVGLLPVHKRVPLLALLYGLMLPSGNDAAIALAQYVAGTQDRFIAMMNARASQLGLRCTRFTTVSGIVDQGNYSCAGDLAILTKAVLSQPLLARIVGSRDAVLPFPIKGGKLYLYNNNPLLRLRYPGADGVKTGYTSASGPCLVATARRGRAWLGVVLLHSADTIDQAEKLLNAGFAKLKRA